MISQDSVLGRCYHAVWGEPFFAGRYDKWLREMEEAGLSRLREQLISRATGVTVEVATGTALNLPYYLNAVTKLYLTELYNPMVELLRDKVGAPDRKTFIIQAPAEKLPFPDGSVDTVVATMILCTARNPMAVLQEIFRILRPGGQFLFLEHIRNRNPMIAWFQDLVQPLWYLWGNGCHCNRPTVRTLERSPLAIEQLRYGRIPKAPLVAAEVIMGVARKAIGTLVGDAYAVR